MIRKTNRIGATIVLLLISVLVGFLIVEAMVRWLELAPPITAQYGNNVPDTYLPYKPRPLSLVAGRSATDEFDYEYRHNSLGLRDVEHEIEKPAGTFRILGLGDSFTYGVGVDFEDSYLRRLEIMLNSRSTRSAPVEIIKAGIPRFFPEPQRILLQEYGVQFEPDLIIVGFLPNDVIDTYLGIDAIVVHESGHLRSRESEELGDLGTVLFEHSDLMRLLLKRYVSYRIAKKYPTYFEDVYEPNGFHERDWQTVEAEYARILARAGSIGSRVLFVHIPQGGPWTERHAYPAARLAAWAEANGADFVSVLPAMQLAAEDETLYYELDGHCTVAGYRVIAETIYEYLLTSGLVP